NSSRGVSHQMTSCDKSPRSSREVHSRTYSQSRNLYRGDQVTNISELEFRLAAPRRLQFGDQEILYGDYRKTSPPISPGDDERTPAVDTPFLCVKCNPPSRRDSEGSY